MPFGALNSVRMMDGIEATAMGSMRFNSETKEEEEYMARKLAHYLGDIDGGYRTFDTDDLPHFFKAVLAENIQVPLVDFEDVQYTDVDHMTKDVLEEGEVLNWWSPQVQPLFPVCDGGGESSLRLGLNKFQLNAMLQYLRTHINIIFEGKYFMKMQHRMQQVCYEDEDSAAPCHHDCLHERLTSQVVSIFTLSNILRQPIVVLSKSRSRDSVGGIYLPFRVAPSECKMWPLVIGYHLGTYSPLIAVRDELQMEEDDEDEEDNAILPLVHSDMKPLAVKCRSFANPDSCKNVCASYLDIAMVNMDGQKQVCAAKLHCAAVKKTNKGNAADRAQRRAVLTSGSSQMWTQHDIFSWTNAKKDCNEETRDLFVTQCLAEGCGHAASLIGKHPLCATCEASMKRHGVIRIGLVGTDVRPATPPPTRKGQNSICRCPCGKNGGSLSSSDEENSDLEENHFDNENLNDLNELRNKFGNVDKCYMNLSIEYG